MLFSQEEFEQKIDEISLKKGLKLLLAKKIELVNKTDNNVLVFLVHEKNSGELFIQIKGKNVLNYSCFCNTKNHCEHLAAALFYLQKEVLHFSNIKEVKLKRNGAIKISRNALLERYIDSIKQVTKPYITIHKLKKEQLSDIESQLLLEKNKASVFRQLLYFSLALIIELPKLDNFKAYEESSALKVILNDSILTIKNSFHKGFSQNETEALVSATYFSLRSQANFTTGMFGFLISRTSILIKDIQEFKRLKLLLKKRKLNKNSLDPIDRKLIAELQLSIMEAKLSNKIYSLKNYELTVELPLALAELEFLQNKNVKGFKLLNDYGDKIKKKNNNMYLDFLDEAFNFSRERNNRTAQEHFLAEKFVCGLTINEKELDFFYQLIPGQEIESKTNYLVKQLKVHSIFYTFEKIAIVLLHQNMLDELTSEIKHQKNKFKILHKIALKKFPQVDEEFVNLYSSHLAQAITEAKFPYFQEQIFNTSKLFLEKLPRDLFLMSISDLNKKTMYDKHMQQFIEKNYPAS